MGVKWFGAHWMVSTTRLGFTIQVIEPDQIFGEYTVIEIAGGEIVDSPTETSNCNGALIQLGVS